MNNKKVADKLDKTLARSKTCQEWKIFERVPNATAIAEGLKDIPAHWSLTPLQDKSPRRDNWQTEPFIPHSTIAELILHGEQKVSKKGKTYTAYWSGFGLRTGEASGGLLALDVDGSSAQPLLDAISGGDIPKTPSWTSGKQGRYQLLFQIPDNIREQLKDFNRAVLTEWGNLQTAKDENGKPTELLEFRYNRSQSCLPPSRHPTTGAYHWINSPADVPVAIAPDWLCQLLLTLASQERQQALIRVVHQQQVEERKRQRQVTGFVGATNLENVIEQAERRLTPDEAFNWTGHNWKHLGRKEWIGYCPRHQSKSGTAFHINPNTLEWFCHGCNEGGHLVQYRWFVRGGNGTPKGQDFVEIVREIAADAGIEMPSLPERNALKPSEPDSELYAEYVTQLEEQARVARAQYQERQQELKEEHASRSLTQWVKRQAERLKRRLDNWQKTLAGQGIEQTPVRATPPKPKRREKFISSPADIRDPQVYRNEGSPLLYYRPGDMALVWQKARRMGYRAVVDTSLTGVGKSETVGRQHIENWFPQPDLGKDSKQRLAYFSQSGENTTAPALENWTPLARMHNGLIERPDKLTGGGKPFVERPKAGETPTIPGNCWATSLHHLLGGKNIGHGGSHAGSDGDSNPICNLCSERDNCKGGNAGRQPSGFKGQMKQALKQPRLKGTLAGFPSEHNFEVVAFVDEAEATISPTKDITASLADIDKEFFRLWQHSKELHDTFSFIQGVLTIYLAEQKPPKYGYDFATIKSWFEQHNLDRREFEWALRQLEEATRTQIQRELATLKEGQAKAEVSELVTLNWLVPFCRVMSGTIPGSVRIVNNRLIVTVKNDRELDLIRSFDFTVLLDATGDRDELAKTLLYQPWEVLWVMEAPRRDVFSNLRVLQITGLGGCGKQRREHASGRIEATEQAIEDWALGKTPNPALDALIGGRDTVFSEGVDPDKIAYIRHLKHYKAGELYYFGGANGERGSNAAQDCQLFIMEGLPRENIGSALARYHVLYHTDCSAEHPAFQAWYNEQVSSRIFQGIGRSRYTRRADQIIPVIILGDFDLSGVQEQYGVPIRQVNAFQITPLAGSKGQITCWKIVEAIEQLRSLGAKITQSAIATLIGKSQETISKIAAPFGKWERLLKILLLLLETPYNKSNNRLDGVNDEQKDLIEEYFLPVLGVTLEGFEHAATPEEALPCVEDTFGAIEQMYVNYGFKGVLRGLQCAPPNVQATLAALLLSALPAEFQSELLILIEGGG